MERKISCLASALTAVVLLLAAVQSACVTGMQPYMGPTERTKTEPDDPDPYRLKQQAQPEASAPDEAIEKPKPAARLSPAEARIVLGDPKGVEATPAKKLLDTMGVGVHVAQGVDNALKSADALAYVGVRNFRDDGRPSALPGWLMMHQRAGLRATVISRQSLEPILDIARRLRAVDALLAVEGPNEPNNFPVTYLGLKSDYRVSFLSVAYFQRDLYAAVKADPALAGVPVFHSSEAGGSQPDNVGLQYLTIPEGSNTLLPAGTQYADYANVHNYVCGNHHRLLNNVAWNAADPTLTRGWDGMWVEYGETWHKKYRGYSKQEMLKLPRVSTETGWWTQGNGAITEAQQASLYLDIYLSSFKHGFDYTFIYMLRDDPKQGYFGMFDPSYEPKPSAKALHAFTTILSDADERAPGRLDYELQGGSENVHDLLLQKSDGDFVLVVWAERFDGQSEHAHVRFAHERATARAFDPLVGEQPMWSRERVSELTLTLSDHPLLLQLSR